MHKTKLAAALALLLAVLLLAACGGPAAKTAIQLELTESYDTADPFIHEKLFVVTKDMDALPLDVSFQMQGESGLLEIADNQTGQVFWSDSWSGDVEQTAFIVTLEAPATETEYVIRFTGTQIIYAKAVVAAEGGLIKERAQPQKSNG